MESHTKDEKKKQEPKRKVLDLTAVQVVASALATVVGAVLASLLGVTGTIIGAAVVSTSATTGAAVFQHAFRRTGEGIRRRVPSVALALTPSEERALQRADARAAFALPDRPSAGAAPPSDDESVTIYGTRRSGSFWKSIGWKKFALATGLVFALAMVTVTVGELIMGKPIAAAVRNESGTGTSLGGGSAGTHAPANSPTPTPLTSSSTGSYSGGTASPSASAEPGTGSSSGARPSHSAASSPAASASTVPSASGDVVNSPDATAR
ncbi:hypothetical protein JHN63_01110 [Streptomyces sp. MBT65]|uniref:hypothetical protein n=1 Tax=Streptomyces sp. MBT65 TaxID=1488395 RepID=UPI00190D45D6|nr:hypothetical protein [Streptomyces sp. MBT65]MBK3572444.1 hypothetical protein [Streptomyces sp. MBT65]